MEKKVFNLWERWERKWNLCGWVAREDFLKMHRCLFRFRRKVYGFITTSMFDYLLNEYRANTEFYIEIRLKLSLDQYPRATTTMFSISTRTTLTYCHPTYPQVSSDRSSKYLFMFRKLLEKSKIKIYFTQRRNLEKPHIKNENRLIFSDSQKN